MSGDIHSVVRLVPAPSVFRQTLIPISSGPSLQTPRVCPKVHGGDLKYSRAKMAYEASSDTA